MKSPLVLLLLALFATSTAHAVERVEARRWRSMKTYDMSALQQIDPPPLRKIVGVRFNYRHSRIEHYKPSWYQGTIWTAHRGQARDDFDYVPVMVRKTDLPAFQALPTDPNSPRTIVVYGEVLKDSQSSFTFLRLLGTKVKRTSRGVVLIGW